MKIKYKRAYIEIHTTDRVYVYIVSSYDSRIDALDDIIALHKANNPQHKIVEVQFYSRYHYSV